MNALNPTYDRDQSRFQIARGVLGRLSLGERLLLALSKHPADVPVVADYEAPTDAWSLESALDSFKAAFPDFLDAVMGQRVLDYGCGDGFQSVAIAKAGAREVVGVDVSEARLGFARDLKNETGQAGVEFSRSIEGRYDLVLSLNAIEHFVDPEENLAEMKAALNPGGRIMATFGPPWLAPFGHHMQFFVKVPWVNLLFSEKTVYRIRSLFRRDGATGYRPDVNQMTVKKFEALIERCGLRAESCVYRVVKDLPLVSKIPFVREFAINQIDVVLVPVGSEQDVLIPRAAARSAERSGSRSSAKEAQRVAMGC